MYFYCIPYICIQYYNLLCLHRMCIYIVSCYAQAWYVYFSDEHSHSVSIIIVIAVHVYMLQHNSITLATIIFWLGDTHSLRHELGVFPKFSLNLFKFHSQGDCIKKFQVQPAVGFKFHSIHRAHPLVPGKSTAVGFWFCTISQLRF